MSKKSGDKLRTEGILNKGYGFSPKRVMKDRDLTIEAKAIYAYLASYSGAGETAFPSVSLICDDLNISERRFRNHRKSLIDKGYIKITRNRQEKGWSNNIYTLVQTVPLQNVSIQNVREQDVRERNVREQNNTTKSNSSKSNSSKSNSINKVRRKYTFDDTHMKLSKLLWNHVKANFPNTKEPNLESWANDIRLMMEQDNRTVAEIKGVIEWSQKNDFWYANIRSAKKLREKYEDMYAQADRENRKKPKKQDFNDPNRYIPKELRERDAINGTHRQGIEGVHEEDRGEDKLKGLI